MNNRLKLAVWRKIGEEEFGDCIHHGTKNILGYSYIVGDVAKVIHYMNKLLSEGEADVDNDHIKVIEDSSDIGRKLEEVFNGIFIPRNDPTYNMLSRHAIEKIEGEEAIKDCLIEIKEKNLEEIAKRIEGIYTIKTD